jgi:hypothetical protein
VSSQSLITVSYTIEANSIKGTITFQVLPEALASLLADSPQKSCVLDNVMPFSETMYRNIQVPETARHALAQAIEQLHQNLVAGSYQILSDDVASSVSEAGRTE